MKYYLYVNIVHAQRQAYALMQKIYAVLRTRFSGYVPEHNRTKKKVRDVANFK